MCHVGKWRGEDEDANVCFFSSPQRWEEKGIIMQLEPRSLASRWSEEEKGQRKEGARTELSREWQEPRTPGPTRGPLPLPRPIAVPPGGRAIAGEAGMLASVCHDGLISGSHVHWRDLIRGDPSDLWGSRCCVWQG